MGEFDRQIFSLGEFFTRVSSDITAVCGSSNAWAASTMIRCAAKLFGPPFKICSAMAMASAGFLFNAILALATWGEEPAPLHIFLKNPQAAPAFLELRRAQRLAAVKKTRLFFQHLIEQRDGVIHIFPLRGFIGLDEQQARLARMPLTFFLPYCLIG